MTVDKNALQTILDTLAGFNCNDGNKIITELNMTTRKDFSCRSSKRLWTLIAAS